MDHSAQPSTVNSAVSSVGSQCPHPPTLIDSESEGEGVLVDDADLTAPADMNSEMDGHSQKAVITEGGLRQKSGDNGWFQAKAVIMDGSDSFTAYNHNNNPQQHTNSDTFGADNNNNPQNSDGLVRTLKDRSWKASLRSMDQFAKPASFGLPKTVEECGLRLDSNLTYFFTNYLLMSLIIATYAVITKPVLLKLIALVCLAWGLALRRDDTYICKCYTLKKTHKIIILTIGSWNMSYSCTCARCDARPE